MEICALEKQWDERWGGGRANRRDTWDRGARAWDEKLRREGVRKRQGEERVRDTVAWLQSRGALTPETDTVDLGCGPGRFTAAFAKAGHSALGVDISGEMVRYGEIYAAEQKIENISFAQADFQSADIAALGWAGSFDLVFASLTPAIRGLEGLRRMMALSRGWCFDACFVSEYNALEERIAREVFGITVLPEKTTHSHWFFELFSLLWHWGYCPEVVYYDQHRDITVEPTEEEAQRITDHILRADAAPPEKTERTLRWLEREAEREGSVRELSDCKFAWVLWNTREKRGEHT